MNGKKVFIVKCISSGGAIFYFAGNNHMELIEHIKKFSRSVRILATWEDVKRENLLKLGNKSRIKEKLKEAEKKIVCIYI